MSDDLIRDRGEIRDSDEPDARDSRYWAAIRRDREMQTVDAVTRLADSEQAGLQARLDQAEARIDQLLDERCDLRRQLLRVQGRANAWVADGHDPECGQNRSPCEKCAKSVAGRSILRIFERGEL